MLMPVELLDSIVRSPQPPIGMCFGGQLCLELDAVRTKVISRRQLCIK